MSLFLAEQLEENGGTMQIVRGRWRRGAPTGCRYSGVLEGRESFGGLLLASLAVLGLGPAKGSLKNFGSVVFCYGDTEQGMGIATPGVAVSGIPRVIRGLAPGYAAYP